MVRRVDLRPDRRYRSSVKVHSPPRHQWLWCTHRMEVTAVYGVSSRGVGHVGTGPRESLDVDAKSGLLRRTYMTGSAPRGQVTGPRAIESARRPGSVLIGASPSMYHVIWSCYCAARPFERSNAKAYQLLSQKCYMLNPLNRRRKVGTGPPIPRIACLKGDIDLPWSRAH